VLGFKPEAYEKKYMSFDELGLRAELLNLILKASDVCLFYKYNCKMKDPLI